MIETTLQTILNATQTLTELMKKSMKASTAYKIARLAREVQREADLFDETRRKLILKYGNRDEKDELVTDENGNVTVAKDKMQDFVKEYEEIMNQKVSLNAELIDLKELEDEKLSPNEINSLMDFLQA